MGDAVPRHGARRRARRGRPIPTPTRWRAACSRSTGFEGTLTTYLAECSADPECAFHNDGDAEGAFDALMAELDETPIPSEHGRPDVDTGVALQAVAEAMYSDSFWDQLSEALAAAQDGDGAGLLDAVGRLLPAASPTARGRTCSRRSRRSAAWTRSSARPSRRTTPTSPQFHAARAALRPGHDGRVLLHVLPADRATRVSRSPAPAPDRSS